MAIKNKQIPIVIIVSVLAVAGGLVGGKLIRQSQHPDTDIALGLSGGGPVEIQQVATDVEAIKIGDIFGSPNEADFKDSAQGSLAVGGIGDDGSHRLIRPGGESQTVYLTSSVTDLDKFEGMEIEVWGETFAGKQAGWLMDVGRVKIINTKAANPSAAVDPATP